VATAGEWFGAARPRTLPAALAPVAVGIGVAETTPDVSAWRAVLCAVVAVSIQIATNYANDYSDGTRGTDEVRVGPTRLVAAKLATPAAVKRAALAGFAVAAIAGAVVAISTSPWLLLIGVACIAAGWFYTGGKHPYGYAGFGELAVFVFFGLVAVCGTVYVTSRHLPALAVVAAVPVGLIAVALLVVNNLRDIPTDRVTGKRTLAVRLGEGRTRALYISCIAGAFVLVPVIAAFRPAALLALAAVVLAAVPIRLVARRARGRELIRVLVMTGSLQLVFGTLLAIGVAA
jgi:1,4-dihydroxy-2-naphthoate octaprenyltransferase